MFRSISTAALGLVATLVLLALIPAGSPLTQQHPVAVLPKVDDPTVVERAATIPRFRRSTPSPEPTALAEGAAAPATPTAAAAPVATPAPVVVPSSADARAFALRQVGSAQYSCLDALFQHESGWNAHATNPYSGAYGIPQALPGGKMGTFGADWSYNPVTQVRWGLWYIAASYGTPCGAWSFWLAHHWY